MSGSLDCPFGSGAVATPVSAGTLLKADATVDPQIGLSPANSIAGDYAIGEAMYDSSTNPVFNPAFTTANLYNQPVKLFFPTFLAAVTGSAVTRGNALYGVTGGGLSPTQPGTLPAQFVAAETVNPLAPGQIIQVFKIYVS